MVSSNSVENSLKRVNRRFACVCNLSAYALERAWEEWFQVAKSCRLTRKEFIAIYSGIILEADDSREEDTQKPLNNEDNETYVKGKNRFNDLFILFTRSNHGIADEGITAKQLDNVQFLGALLVASKLSPSQKLQFLHKYILLDPDLEMQELDLGAVMTGVNIAFEERKSSKEIFEDAHRKLSGKQSNERLLMWLAEYSVPETLSDSICIKGVRNSSFNTGATFKFTDVTSGSIFGESELSAINSNRLYNSENSESKVLKQSNHKIPLKCKKIRLGMYLVNGSQKQDLNNKGIEETEPVCEISIDFFQMQSSASCPSKVSEWISLPDSKGEVEIEICPEQEEETSFFDNSKRNNNEMEKLALSGEKQPSNIVRVNPYAIEWVIGYENQVEAKLLASGRVVYAANHMVVVHDAKLGVQNVFTLHQNSVSCVAVHPNGKFLASMEIGTNLVHIWDASILDSSKVPQSVLLTSFNAVSFLSLKNSASTKIQFTEDDNGSHLVILDSDSGIISVYDWLSNGILVFSEKMEFNVRTFVVRQGCIIAIGDAVAILKTSFKSKISKSNGLSRPAFNDTYNAGRKSTCFKTLFCSESPEEHMCCATFLRKNEALAITGTKTGHLCVWNESKCIERIENAHKETIEELTETYNVTHIEITSLSAISPTELASGDNHGTIKTWESSTLIPMQVFRPFKINQKINGICPALIGSGVLITPSNGPLCNIELKKSGGPRAAYGTSKTSKGNQLSSISVTNVFQTSSSVSSFSEYTSNGAGSKTLESQLSGERKEESVFAAFSCCEFLKIWSVDSKKVIKNRRFDFPITAIATCNVSRMIAVATSNEKVYYVDIESLEITDSFSTRANEFLSFSSDGKLLACAKGLAVNIFHMGTLVVSLKLKRRARSPAQEQGNYISDVLRFTDENRKLRYRTATWETKNWKMVKPLSEKEKSLITAPLQQSKKTESDLGARMLKSGGVVLQVSKGWNVSSAINSRFNAKSVIQEFPSLINASASLPRIPDWVYGYSHLTTGSYLLEAGKTSSRSIIYPAACYAVICPFSNNSKIQRYFTMPNERNILAMAANLNGSTVATCSSEEVVIWDFEQLKILQRIAISNPISITFYGSSELVVSNSKLIALYSWKTGVLLDYISLDEIGTSAKPVKVLMLQETSGNKTYESSSSQVAILFESGQLQIWNTLDRLLFTWEISVSCISSLGLVGTKSGDLYLLDLSKTKSDINESKTSVKTKNGTELNLSASLALRKVKNAHNGCVVAVADDPKGGFISSGTDQTIKFWSSSLKEGQSTTIEGVAQDLTRSSSDNRLFFACSTGDISYLVRGASSWSKNSSSGSSLHVTPAFCGFGTSYIDRCVFGEKNAICVVGENKAVYLGETGKVRSGKLKLDKNITPCACSAFEIDEETVIISIALSDRSLLLLDKNFRIVGRTNIERETDINPGEVGFSETKVSKKLYLTIKDGAKNNILKYEIVSRPLKQPNDSYAPVSVDKSGFIYDLKLYVEDKKQNRKTKKDKKKSKDVEPSTSEMIVLPFNSGLVLTDGVGLTMKQNSSARESNFKLRTFKKTINSPSDSMFSKELSPEWIFGGGKKPSLNAVGNLVYYIGRTCIVNNTNVKPTRQNHIHHDKDILSISLNHTGTLIATTTDTSMHLWDANALVSIFSMEFSGGLVQFSPDESDRLAVFSLPENVLEIFESFPPGSSEHWHNSLHRPLSNSTAMNGNPKVLEWLDSNTIIAGNNVTCLTTGHTEILPGVEHLQVTSVANRSVENWRLSSSSKGTSFDNRSASIIVGTASGKICVLELNKGLAENVGSIRETISAHDAKCTQLCKINTRNGQRIISSGLDSRVIIWGPDLKQMKVIPLHAPVLFFNYSECVMNYPFERLIIGCSNMDIVEYDMTSYRSEMLLHSAYRNLRISSNPVLSNVVATIDRHLCIRLWDVRTKNLIHVDRNLSPKMNSQVVAMHWHPEGRILGVATDDALQLVSFHSMSLSKTCTVEREDTEGKISDFKFLGDRLVLSTTNSKLEVYNVNEDPEFNMSCNHFKTHSLISLINGGDGNEIKIIDLGIKQKSKKENGEEEEEMTIIQVFGEAFGNIYIDLKSGEKLGDDIELQVSWDTWSSPVGWRMEGTRENKDSFSDEHASIVCLSKSKNRVLVVSKDCNSLSLYEFPAAPDVRSIATIGRTNEAIRDIAFLGNDEKIAILTDTAIYTYNIPLQTI